MPALQAVGGAAHARAGGATCRSRVYALALTVLHPRAGQAADDRRRPGRARLDHAHDRLLGLDAGDRRPADAACSAARAAAERFLGQVPGAVRVGLVAFNQNARLAESPTTDREAVRAAIGSLRPSGGTATGEALALSLGVLARQTDEDGRRVPSAIILLSDGKSVRGRPPTQIAERAKDLKIPIYTVTLGTAAGTITVRRRDGTTDDAARAPRPGREPRGRADLRREARTPPTPRRTSAPSTTRSARGSATATRSARSPPRSAAARSRCWPAARCCPCTGFAGSYDIVEKGPRTNP